MITQAEFGIFQASQQLANDIRRAVFAVEEKVLSLKIIEQTQPLSIHNQKHLSILEDVLTRLKKLFESVITTHELMSQNIREIDVSDADIDMLSIVFAQQRNKLDNLMSMI